MTRRSWQLQEAKNRLSEVVERALTEGPQTVTRHGREAVVILAAAEYRRLKGARSFKAFLRKAPLQDLDLRRTEEAPRKLDFG